MLWHLLFMSINKTIITYRDYSLTVQTQDLSSLGIVWISRLSL